MLKNKKGISVITLIVTIIVLIIITSITVFTGNNMVSASREKALKDRLNVIYNAVVSHEKELGYGDTVIEKQITPEEYHIMGLSDYADEENFTPVYISKEIHDTDSYKRIYKLKTLKKKDSAEYYEMEPKVYTLDIENTNTMIEFDVEKGVNRPQILEGMIPLDTYIDEDEDIRTREVRNIYTEDWYDYSLTTPKWANMELDNEKYVWIPRFAYKVQDFYLNKNYEDVPSSAIGIIFLKRDTNYMANDEILPDGYQVHPAFSTSDGRELAGIWISKYLHEDVDSLAEAVDKSYKMYEGSASIESHLIKNSEYAAMAYLSFASGGNSRDGNTLNNSYGICDINSPEFVAACLDGDDEKFDIYSYNGTKLTYESNETTKAGDALIATSSGNSENSSWYKGTSILPTADKPYVLRRGDQSFFAYEAYNGTRNNTSYRNVVTILGSESVNNLADLKAGDYVSYEPDTPTPGVSWRVWATKGNKVIIMPTSPVGSLTLGPTGEEVDYIAKRAEAFNDYKTAIDQIEALCDKYTCSALGVTPSNIRSLRIEDLEDPKVSDLATKKLTSTSGSEYGTLTTYTNNDACFAASYNEATGNNEMNVTLVKATSSNPVTLKQTYYSTNVPNFKAFSDDPRISNNKYYHLLGNNYGWLASTFVQCSPTFAWFYVGCMSSGYIKPEVLLFSYGQTESATWGVRPLITLNGSQLMLNESNSGSGSSSSPWNIVKK